MSNEEERTHDGHGGNGETTSRRDDVSHLSERNEEKKENGVDHSRDKSHKSHKSRKHSSRSNESSRRKGSRSRKSRSRSHKRSRHSRSKEDRHKSSHRSRSRSPKKVTSIRELRAERERRKEKGDKKSLSSAIENINSVVKKKSLFDVMPGSDIPQPKLVAAPINIPPSISLHPNMIIAPKFAKSIYVGGIDPGSTNEKDLFDFFNNVINLVTGKQLNAVTTMYINKMKCFGFLEVNDYNLASAVIQQLNGVEYKGSSLSLRRPTNYDPNKAPPPGDLPMMDVTKVGLKPGKPSTYVENTSDKIYIAGIPFTVSDDQLQELLESFGPLESMCVVRERGYAFCMYKDKSVTDIACEGLNGMQVGTQALIVKRADVSQKLPGLDPVAMAAMGLGINPNTHQMNIMQSLGAQNLGLPQHPSSNPLSAVPSNAGYLMGGNLPNPFVGDLARPSGVDKILKPSRILVLRNMVTEDELRDDNEYNDIKVDVQQECSSYGNVEEVVIPRPNRSYHVAGLGKIFVVFREEIDAIQARGGLEGRSFGTRKVVCEFIEEGKFGRKEFD